MSVTSLSSFEEEKGSFPARAAFGQIDGTGRYELAVNEHGLMSPVAKIEMTRSDAKRFFFAAWSSLLDEDD